LDIGSYEVRRGNVYSSATVVGNITGLFSTIFETASGTYKYWVTPIDYAGNYGASSSISCAVSQPPDYVLVANQFSALSGTLSNAVKYNGAITMPVNTAETYQAHFTTNSWATPSAQVSGGFPLFIEPSLTTGYYEEVIDYGGTVGSAKISITPTYDSVNSPNVQIDISVSNISSTGAWTNYTNVSQVFATTFRWVKWRITVTSTGSDDFVVLSSCNIKLDSKQKTDSGMVSCVSSDTGGTVVTFGTAFTDISSINVSPSGTTAQWAIYDFVDIPNPTSFKVLLFNSAGTRISGLVSWTARGV
jgi:hypothetical protein